MLLLHHDADVNIQNHSGHTPLHMAVARDNMECCVLLCQAGADINTRTSTGQTPLHVAARAGAVSCLYLLLQLECDATACDNQVRQKIDITMTE